MFSRVSDKLLLAGWPAHLASSHDVYVNVKHSLTGVTSVIDDDSVTGLINTELSGHLARHHQQMSQQLNNDNNDTFTIDSE